MNGIGAIVLAAGRGKRMNLQNANKVTLPLGGIPMIKRTVALLNTMDIATIVVVVGHADASVRDVLGDTVSYAFQKEQRGTAHAVQTGLEALPSEIETVLVVNGDDSALYTQETIQKLMKQHAATQSAVTFLTTLKNNPAGLGRIIRNTRGEILKIIEEKDADKKEKNLQEVNIGCYLFQVSFLKKYMPRLEKSSVTGEYYLTRLIDLAVRYNEPVQALCEKDLLWIGINTAEDLQEAERIIATNHE